MSSFVKVQNCDKERRRTIAIEQPITVRVEHGGIPQGIIDRQSDKLAEKDSGRAARSTAAQIARVERFQQQSPQRAARAGSTNGFPA
ncbi:hypothetical protein [Bradyrhizobium australiense]|uniref:Uncharacterized protein n=1 Tax=Bradyrhizobium australiense TaxID=2721161 RepID=A0A7Y4GZ60_9BRAD|nr:hypothetical protein [Bradyrhizobium australiense]NOJ43917.1 hypothetical protein [Bradyrhizobium australiense]